MKKNYIILTLFIIIAGMIYFLIKKPNTLYETVYLASDTIYVPDSVLVPYKVEVPAKPLEIDTAAVVDDYFKRYNYSQRLFLDTLGYVDVRFGLEQNRLQGLNYNFELDFRIPTPITYKNQISIQRSIMHNTYQLNYQRDITKRITFNTSITTNNDLLLGVGYKF